jgi:hypothetical protein
VADSSLYYFKHVYWAAENGITNGYNLEYFDPQGTCTREQMMTFLWRLAGKPNPKSTTSKFEDVQDKSAYYYKAISLLGGKKAFSVLRPVINEIEELLQSALGFNPKGLYYYFWAYIRYDHHARKLYRVSPDYRELIGMAKQFGVSAGEVAGLYRALGVPRPDCI